MRLIRFVWLAAITSLLLSGCLDELAGTGSATRQPPLATAPAGGDWWSIYFTTPGDRSTRPDAPLAEAIRKARLTVDIAAYDFSLWSLREALIAAHRRGVAVRMVTDSDNLGEPEIQDLVKAGIRVIGDRREGLMHNKFVVIDRQEVWTGSMNFTLSGATHHDNNLVRLRSTRLAENYTVEFTEMFEDDRFGPGSPANTPFPTLTINETPVEVYFTPDDGAIQRLAALVQGAQESVYFLAYSFTSDELGEALLERAAAGVTVTGVFDRDQVKSNRGGEYARLQAAGLAVRLDGNPDLMHHKVIVIDQKIVITGSYNFSYNAETRNDENVLVIFDAEMAQLFLQEFERIFQAAR